jgi:hypothetical protein
MWVIYTAYIAAGLGIGSFECNFVSCLTPLGNTVKVWGVMGMPLGYNGLSTTAFGLFAAVSAARQHAASPTTTPPPPPAPHSHVNSSRTVTSNATSAPDGDFTASADMLLGILAALCVLNALVGPFIFWRVLPHIPFEASRESLRTSLAGLSRWRQWLPQTAPHFFAITADMFIVILINGGATYIYDVADVPIFGRHGDHSGGGRGAGGNSSSITNNTSSANFSMTMTSSSGGLYGAAAAPPRNTHYATVPKNTFLCILNVAGFLGDFLSRHCAYRFPVDRFYDFPASPIELLVLTALGGAAVLSKIGIFAWFGMFFVMFANGYIYATTTRRIDAAVSGKFNLVVLSVWLFCGDAGSSIGSSVTNAFTRVLGKA